MLVDGFGLGGDCLCGFGADGCAPSALGAAGLAVAAGSAEAGFEA